MWWEKIFLLYRLRSATSEIPRTGSFTTNFLFVAASTLISEKTFSEHWWVWHHNCWLSWVCWCRRCRLIAWWRSTRSFSTFEVWQMCWPSQFIVHPKNLIINLYQSISCHLRFFASFTKRFFGEHLYIWCRKIGRRETAGRALFVRMHLQTTSSHLLPTVSGTKTFSLQKFKTENVILIQSLAEVIKTMPKLATSYFNSQKTYM